MICLLEYQFLVGYTVLGLPYSINSTNEFVTSGTRFFLTMNILRGGDGHRRDKRSLPRDSEGASALTVVHAHRNPKGAHLDMTEIASEADCRYRVSQLDTRKQRTCASHLSSTALIDG